MTDALRGLTHRPNPTVARPKRRHDHTREDTLATATDVNVKPLEDRVLVTIDEQEQTTASGLVIPCLLYTSPSPRDGLLSRMPSSA